MASSIETKTLTVTINESLSLGSDDFGNRTQFEVPGVAEVSQRILTVPTYKTSVLILSSSSGAGTFASGSYQSVLQEEPRQGPPQTGGRCFLLAS